MKTINVTFEDFEYEELIEKKKALKKKLKMTQFSWQKFIMYLNKHHNGGFKKVKSD